MIERGNRYMKKRIMVVDDSRVMEYQICEMLEGSDFEVAAYCCNV